MKHKKMPSIPLNPIHTPASIQIPHHFRCPISLELMHDPVTVSSGQTFDRLSIESWFSTGNSTCPVTRTPLSDLTLIPNHTLRRLIQSWCVSFGVQRIPTPKQPADISLLRSLLSHPSPASFRRLTCLARDSEKNRAMIGALDVRSVCLRFLFVDEESEELRFEALSLLALFPPVESDCGSIGSDPKKVDYLVKLLFHPSSVEIRVNSACLIESIIAGAKSPELRSSITDSDEIFAGVVGILTDLPSPRALKVGVKTLFALCLHKQHRHRAVTAGAVHALIGRLPELDKCDCERALATVELLCRIQEGCEAFGEHALTVPLLVKTILKVSDRATEYAAGALMSLCSSSEKLQKEAVNAGVLTQMLLLVQSDCTERAKRKAQMMLKLLRDSWPQDSVHDSDNFHCSDVLLN